jgi:hypothetical protein
MDVVPIVPERPEINAELDALKKDCIIGIFGSYEQANLTKLVLLQIFLKRQGYENALIASDLQERFSRKKGEIKSKYNHRLSNNLIRISNIHIFVFFYETNRQHGINMSALGEMQEAKNRGKKNIILYFDRRARKQIASYYETFFDDPPEGWEIKGYKEDIKTKYDHVLGFLLEMCERIRRKK